MKTMEMEEAAPKDLYIGLNYFSFKSTPAPFCRNKCDSVRAKVVSNSD